MEAEGSTLLKEDVGNEKMYVFPHAVASVRLLRHLNREIHDK